MMESLSQIPELHALEARRNLIRIPDQSDVPLTPRVRELIDTEPFRRLAGISQLGLVSQVYPAAHHTRFEHSLGVFRLGLQYLQRLRHEDRFTALVTPWEAELFLAAALLHDLGHWPFCHLVEDMNLPNIPRHEQLASEFLDSGPLADSLWKNWGVRAQDIAEILSGNGATPSRRLLGTMLSGPIDIDKLDYLDRDSLHAGVPYGRNFDQERLIGSLCLNETGDQLAISEKGRTAAEMMVFARYVMFSEVYWHHAVRTASAMFQRAFYRLQNDINKPDLFVSTEPDVIATLRSAAGRRSENDVSNLLEGLFGPRRRLFKRVLELSIFQHAEIYQRIARQPYPWLVTCSERLAAIWGTRLGREMAADQVLIDAPPAKLEVQFDVDVYFPKEDRYRALAEVSPVVRTLACEQFDDHVKRVRVFVAPDLRDDIRRLANLESDLLDASSGVRA